MRRGWILALVMALACGTAQAASRHHHHRHGFVYGGSVGVMRPGAVYTSRGHYAALVGDPGGGLGFYPLPLRYRVGAWRYRLRTAPPPWEVPPVIAAAQAQAARYYGMIPTAANSYRFGVYNPIDGVGSPFFAGYYGPAGDDDDDSGFPFGLPYGP